LDPQYRFLSVNGFLLFPVVESLTFRTSLASTGLQWMQTFARENRHVIARIPSVAESHARCSGSYNNQWIVVDYKLFVAGQPLADGLLWIGEQYPGAFPFQDATAVCLAICLCVAVRASADVAQYLRLGYWPSYNIPFMPGTYAAMGYPAMCMQHPSPLGYWC
jgi:hypothetical protein